MYFFNGQKYDNSIILKSICNIFKNDVSLNCIGNSCESFKMIDFKFKKIKYSLKSLDMCNFIKGSLNDLSKNLNDKNKFITKEHFKDNFELLNEKTCFPYEFITKENIYNENLPSIENFYSSLKLDNITKEDYDKTLVIYKNLNCKNIKEYLDIYLKLQADIFNVFRNCIWDKFEIDRSKYITSCSLSLDLMLKYIEVKIELIRDISIFDYVNSSILGGICIASQNIENDKNGIISSWDVHSLYPYVMTQKLPIGNYKFIKYAHIAQFKHAFSRYFFCILFARGGFTSGDLFLGNSFFPATPAKSFTPQNFSPFQLNLPPSEIFPSYEKFFYLSKKEAKLDNSKKGRTSLSSGPRVGHP